MSDLSDDEIRHFWNEVAAGWRIQVGRDGDANRRFNSDPVLWAFLGDVAERDVLDAGCGTGYLTRQLHDRGARVVGVDLSEEMIRIARSDHPAVDFRVDSISTLTSIADRTFDALVSNYVLMDTPDLEAAIESFHRVLRPGGVAALVFSHPCFPQGRAGESDDGHRVTYEWRTSYFQRGRQSDPPWAHFTRDFIWFHRPLSDYWKAFAGAGFSVEAFEEPRITEERYGSVTSDERLKKLKERPYSVAFKLRRLPG